MYYAFYRQVPGGVQRLEPPAVGPVDDLVGELLATGEEALLVGDGALRYREQISAGLRRIEFAEQWLAQPAAAPLVQLAHAQRAAGGVGATRGSCSRCTCGKPDAEINWVTRESARRSGS